MFHFLSPFPARPQSFRRSVVSNEVFSRLQTGVNVRIPFVKKSGSRYFTWYKEEGSLIESVPPRPSVITLEFNIILCNLRTSRNLVTTSVGIQRSKTTITNLERRMYLNSLFNPGLWDGIQEPRRGLCTVTTLCHVQVMSNRLSWN